MISAIVSSFNEVHNSLFWENLALLQGLGEGRAEIWVVDGGSTDGTLEELRRRRVPVELLPGTNRAQRYNHGIKRAQGAWLLLVHPRSGLSKEVLIGLESLDEQILWGACTHQFDHAHPLLAFTSWYSNRIRGRGRSIYYLDHCLFVSQKLREHAVFPEVDLFEDTGFCRKLRRLARPHLLPARVTTSAVRFRRNGIWRQAVLNQVLKVMHYLRFSERWMNRIYEKGLSLNRK